MRQRSPLAAGLIAGLLVITLTPTGSVANPPEPAAAGPGAAVELSPDPSRRITLITGDRVTVGADGSLSVEAGAGRDDITFLVRREGEHRSVIPSDATAMLNTGQVDRRLFDVTLLRELGYHDGRGDLPLIVTQQGRLAASRASGTTGVRDLPAVEGASLRLSKQAAGTFWQDLVAAQLGVGAAAAGGPTVWLDGVRQPLLDQSVPQVGAPQAWAQGLDGSGVSVAVLDTGVDATHPDLADRIVAQANFVDDDDRDLVGHGTHVASILAGSGAASGGRYRGVAPGVDLVAGKVCGLRGCNESAILAGMQWAAEQGADVVNMSLGGGDAPGVDPVEQAVETLTEQYGVLFVIAAGNDGANYSINSPASADAALAVGSVDKQDQLAGTSSRGPRIDGALKPDLTAPGVEIVAANSKDGMVGTPGQPYTTLSGTSMATPHVAGGAAILVQQHPDWSPEEVKAALMASAVSNPDLHPYAEGAGRLDISRAITQTVMASPPSVSFAPALWPHDDDEPQTRTFSYHNDGDADVTLDLAVITAGPGGGPVPEGYFTVSDSTVTVPAGGSAQVSVIADTSVGDVAGYLGGRITATGPGVVVTTPFAVDAEEETFEVTLVHTDPAGAPTAAHHTGLFRLDALWFAYPTSGDGTTTVRVPAGEYTLMSWINHDTGGGKGSALLAQPRLVVDRDLTVWIDARLARPVAVTVPDPEAAPAWAVVTSQVVTDELLASFTLLGFGFDGLSAGRIGPDQTLDNFVSLVSGTWAKPDPAGGFDNSPFTYDLAWFDVGRMMTGFTREVRDGDLASVRAEHAAHVPGAVGARSTLGVLPGVVDDGPRLHLRGELPLRRTEYHNTDGGVRWLKFFTEELPGGRGDPVVLSSATSAATRYEAGHEYREQWNQAVFGPVLPGNEPAVTRLGDEMRISPFLYGDRAGRPMSTLADGGISVYRDGELLAELPLRATVEVPPEPAGYRVEIDAVRDPQSVLSTRTSLSWTFRSGHVAGDEPVPLPVSVVRFTPSLDLYNTAPAGRVYVVPVHVQSGAGSEAGGPASLAVEVSYDDGQSWQEARVLGGRLVLLSHPEGDGFVSLRATASDGEGSSVTQTVIRAYRIG